MEIWVSTPGKHEAHNINVVKEDSQVHGGILHTVQDIDGTRVGTVLDDRDWPVIWCPLRAHGVVDRETLLLFVFAEVNDSLVDPKGFGIQMPARCSNHYPGESPRDLFCCMRRIWAHEISFLYLAHVTLLTPAPAWLSLYLGFA